MDTVVYSPDGKRLLTASDDGTARLWDPRTGVQLLSIAGGGQEIINAGSNKDGTLIYTIDASGMIRTYPCPKEPLAQGGKSN